MKIFRILIFFFLINIFLCESFEIIGYKFLKDPEILDITKRFEIVPIGEGGIFQIYIKNNSNEPLEIKNIKINGKNFSELEEWIFRKKMDVSKWWNLYPRSIQPGKIGTLRFRYFKIQNFGEKIKIIFETNIGNFEKEFNLIESPLKLKYVGFAEDLKKVFLFVQNIGKEPVEIKDIYFDGKNVNGNWRKKKIGNNEITIGEVSLNEPLQKGEFIVIRVISDKERYEANCSLRIFPSRFYFTGWMMGSSADIRDLKRIHFNYESNPPTSQRAKELRNYGIFSEINVLQDEPLGAGISPQDVSNKFLNAMSNKDVQYAIQLTGFGENLTYSDMADIHIHHHHPAEESNFVHKLNDPKPVLYLPQTTWNNWEALDHEEKNKPRQWAGHTIDEQVWRTYESIGYGAKGLIWFIYCNLWNQSMNYWGGLEYDGTFPDPIIQGMINNPLLWRKVEEINGTFSIVSDYLSISAPFYNEKTKDNISVNGLICWNDVIVITVVNNNYFKNRGYPTFCSYKIEIPVPDWVKVKNCAFFDYYRGIGELKNWKFKDGRLEIIIPEIRVGKLILITPSENTINEIKKKWEEISPWSKKKYDYLINEVFTEEEKHNEWLLKDKRWRNFVKITPERDGRNLIVKIPLDIGCDFKKGQLFDENSVEIIEVDKNGKEIGKKKFSLPYSKKLEENWTLKEVVYKTPLKNTGKGEISKENNVVKIIKNSPFGPDYGCYWQGINFSDEWISSDYPILRIVYNFDKNFTSKTLINFNFDLDGDKKRDGGTGFDMWRRIPEDTIEKEGWKITEWNWVKACIDNKKENPESKIPKYGNFWIQTTFDNEEKENIVSEILIKEIKFLGNNNIYILLDGENKKGKDRYFYIYYDTGSNKKGENNISFEEIQSMGEITQEFKYEQKIETASLNSKFKSGKNKVEVEIEPKAELKSIIVRRFDGNKVLQEEIIPEFKGNRYFTSISLVNNLKYIQIKGIFGDFLEKNFLYEYPSFKNIIYEKEEKTENLKIIYDTGRPLYDIKVTKEKIYAGGKSIYCLDENGNKIWEIQTEVPVKQIEIIEDRILGIIGKWEKETGNYKISKAIMISESGEKIWERSFAPFYIRKIDISPDKSKFALITWHDPQGLRSTCYIFDKNGKEINKFICEGTYSTELKFWGNDRILIGNSPQSFLVCYDLDGKVKFRSKIKGTNVSNIKTYGNRIYAIGYNLYCLDENGNKIWERECGIYPRVMGISEDGKYIATGTLDGTFSVFDIEGNLLKEIKFEDGIINHIISDKESFIFVVDRFTFKEEDGWLNYLELYKVKFNGEIIERFKGEKRPFLDEARISKDGKKIFVSSYDGKIRSKE